MDLYETDRLNHDGILSVFGFEDDLTHELSLFFVSVILFVSHK